MKKLKIVQTPTRFYPYVGGVEKYTLDLSTQLVKQGNKVKIICAMEPKSNIKKVAGIHIKKLNYLFKITNTNITPGLFMALLKEDFDVIHTHFPTPWSADISMLVALVKRKPLILTYHNDVSKQGFAGFLATIYSTFLLRLLFKISKKIIITNQSYLKQSRHLGEYSNKVVIIPNGIDSKRYYQKKIKKVPNQIFFLSVLDKFHEYKGLDYLIQAIKFVKIKKPNIKLVVGGEGELVSNYKLLTKKLGLEKNIEFRGFIEDRELMDLYNQSELFVLPSTGIQEGFGIVLLEALACGTPVVATDIVGIAKDIKKENCGVVVSPKDVKGLAEGIISVISKPDKRILMGRNGRKLVEEKYQWSKNVKLVNAIYQEVVK